MLIFNNELVSNGKPCYFLVHVGFILGSSHDFLSYFGCCPDWSHMIRPFLETSGQGGDLGSRVALEAGSGDVIRQLTELLAHVATNLHAVVTSG